MKKITVIGSRSFLARNFIRYSLNKRYDYSFKLYDFMESQEFQECKSEIIDFGDINSIRSIDFDVDVIMLFIGKTGTTIGFEQYVDFIRINEIMLLNILQVYKEKNSKALIVYPSSRLVYKSNDERKIDEAAEREYRSVYAITKQAAENYLKLYHEVFDIRYVVLHICTPIGTLLDGFGSYGTFEILKKQAIEKKEITLFGDGLQRKTFTQMEDICKAFTLLIDKGYPNYHEYNLGGQDLSFLDIAEMVAKEYNVKIQHIPWPDLFKKVDGGSVVFDSTRFDEEYGMEYLHIIA